MDTGWAVQSSSSRPQHTCLLFSSSAKLHVAFVSGADPTSGLGGREHIRTFYCEEWKYFWIHLNNVLIEGGPLRALHPARLVCPFSNRLCWTGSKFCAYCQGVAYLLTLVEEDTLSIDMILTGFCCVAFNSAVIQRVSSITRCSAHDGTLSSCFLF